MDTINILYRNIKLRFNNSLSIFMTILQPMIWLILYSKVASETMKASGIENYTAFVLPGLIILLSFGVCASTGMMNFIMKSNGSFYRILIAPIKRSSIVLGQILEGVFCSFLEVLIMISFALLLGVNISIKTGPLVIAVILLFLTAFFMASISYSISLSLANEIIYETIMNAIVLPLFFLSSALFPVDNLQGFLNFLINLNPFTHIINLLRSIILTGNVNLNSAIRTIAIFLVLNTISFFLACKKLSSEIKA